MNVGEAQITGPITGGRGRPWSTSLVDVTTRGYVLEEFFLQGTAVSYQLRDGTEPSADGRWDAVTADEAPFTTRVLVARPADPAAFNGTAVVSWLNVTAGYELGSPDDDELLSGYAWIGVSAQKVGIHGFPPGAPGYSGRQVPQKPLREWDPERYGVLDHPGDVFSFDIFTQAGRAVRSGAVMGGLDVQRVIATGASQSGARLTTYVNAVHPLVGVYDAFMPTITGGWGTPLGAATRAPATAGAATGATGAQAMRPGTKLRDDLDAPIMVINSECEALGMFSARRDDGPRFRFWEVAGAPHVVAVAPPAEPRPEGKIDNPLSYRPVVSAAYRAMHQWLIDGTEPPSLPRIDIELADGRPQIVRDAHGNATGGIRLPELAAPIAEYHGRDSTAAGLGTLYGWARPFSRDELRAMYPSRDAYIEAYRKGVDHLLASGALRSEDAPAMRDQAEKVAADLDL